MSKYGTYSAVHDNLLRKYRRYSLYGVWTGFLGLMCLIIFATGLLQDNQGYGIGGVYNSGVMLSVLICGSCDLDNILFVVFNFIFLFIFGGLMAFLGYQAHGGNKKALIASIMIYGADSLVLAFSPLSSYYRFIFVDYMISIIAHLVVLFVLAWALFKRHELIELAAKQKAELDIPESPDQEKIVLSYRRKKRRDAENKSFGDEISPIDKEEDDKKK